MKTIKIIIAITFFTMSTANAQITKGNWMVGGSGNFSSYEIKNSNDGVEKTRKSITTNLSPNVGYFIADKFVVGAEVNIGYSKPQGYESNIGYGLGPFVRYYFLKEENRINIFGQASYNFAADKSSDYKSKSNGYGFKAGPVIFFNSSVALEITLDYIYGKFSSGSSSATSNNLQIGLGFQIHLEK